MARFIPLILLAVLVGCGSSSSASGAPSAPKAESKVGASSDEKMTFTSRLRVGHEGTVTVPLKNTGSAKAAEIEFMTNKEFSEAWIVNSSTPKWQSNKSSGDSRFIKFEGLAPGESFTYALAVTGKTPGEHDFKLTLSVDGKYVTTFSGRAVVLP